MQRGVAYEIIGNKIKVKYESFEWNQHKPSMDIFENINQVQDFCGNGDTLEEAVCWLDTFNWSVMNKTTLTEDIYQFITHRVQLIKNSVNHEISAFHINWEKLDPLIEYASSVLEVVGL